VEASFEIAEEDGDGLDALLVGEVLDAPFPNLVSVEAVGAVGLGFKVLFFEFLIREGKKIAEFCGHGSPLDAKGRRPFDGSDPRGEEPISRNRMETELVRLHPGAGGVQGNRSTGQGRRILIAI